MKPERLSADLQADYDALGALLGAMTDKEGAAAAALVRERRILRALIEQLPAEQEAQPVVDKLAGNVTRLDKGRRGRSGNPGAPAGGRKSG